MKRSFRVVKGTQTLRDFADQYLLNNDERQTLFAASNGRYLGMVQPDRLSQIERSQWEVQTVANIVQPLADIPAVKENTSLLDVVDQMESAELRELTVLSPAGAIAGLIERSEIVKGVMTRMEITLPDVELEKIQQSQEYPSFMPLPKIVESIKPESDSLDADAQIDSKEVEMV